ncbi:MAG: hypothetical protein PHN92_06495 [Geobacter sp.]|nr:hypothetical protein [Geobacter sp.]
MEGRYAIDRIPENIERSTLQGTIGAAARIAAGSSQENQKNDVTATSDKRARSELESRLKIHETAICKK